MRGFKPLVTACHLPYIFLQKTQRRSLNVPPCRLKRTQRKSLKPPRLRQARVRFNRVKGKPSLSGREDACRRRKYGEDCLSEASSAAPDGGSSNRASKPDNSGGASWFVLLAAEKNEQIEIPYIGRSVDSLFNCSRFLCYSILGFNSAPPNKKHMFFICFCSYLSLYL